VYSIVVMRRLSKEDKGIGREGCRGTGKRRRLHHDSLRISQKAKGVSETNYAYVWEGTGGAGGKGGHRRWQPKGARPPASERPGQKREGRGRKGRGKITDWPSPVASSVTTGNLKKREKVPIGSHQQKELGVTTQESKTKKQKARKESLPCQGGEKTQVGWKEKEHNTFEHLRVQSGNGPTAFILDLA